MPNNVTYKARIRIGSDCAMSRVVSCLESTDSPKTPAVLRLLDGGDCSRQLVTTGAAFT